MPATVYVSTAGCKRPRSVALPHALWSTSGRTTLPTARDQGRWHFRTPFGVPQGVPPNRLQETKVGGAFARTSEYLKACHPTPSATQLLILSLVVARLGVAPRWPIGFWVRLVASLFSCAARRGPVSCHVVHRRPSWPKPGRPPRSDRGDGRLTPNVGSRGCGPERRRPTNAAGRRREPGASTRSSA